MDSCKTLNVAGSATAGPKGRKAASTHPQKTHKARQKHPGGLAG